MDFVPLVCINILLTALLLAHQLRTLSLLAPILAKLVKRIETNSTAINEAIANIRPDPEDEDYTLGPPSPPITRSRSKKTNEQ